MWKDPKGWDTPGRDNAQRAAAFRYESFETEGMKLLYRHFVPQDGGKGLPLVLFLHGADVAGSDNESQLLRHDIGTVFATEEWQKEHPCHILAPQYPEGSHWAGAEMLRRLEALLDSVIAKEGCDPSRICLYGYSAGAIGLLELIRRRPHFYAAAIAICGAAEDRSLEELADTPLWFFHAEDDSIVPCSARLSPGGQRRFLGSVPLSERLNALGAKEIRLTLYPDGYMEKEYHLNPHCSWVPAGEDEEAQRWLFSAVRTAALHNV
ncbi:MAG: hypothetical protein K5697_00650 [Lachnospiraceae bacterium]|nr:hypothetical protein [Lachnospiraceae bacterium]